MKNYPGWRAVVIPKNYKIIITKWDRFWLLQSETTSITKWDGCIIAK